MARKQAGEVVVEGTLSSLVAEITKEYGDGIIRQGSAIQNITHIPSDVFILDMALLGGLPENRIILTYGNPSSGKSFLSLRCAASAQMKYPDSKVVYINLESQMDKDWVRANGVDLDRFYEAQPQSGEQAADILIAAVAASDVNFIVIDSLAFLVPMKESEGSMGDNQISIQARLQSKMFRNLRSAMNEEARKGHKVTVFCINQFRTNVGQMFGDNRTLPGGSAQNYSADVKIEMKNKEVQSKEGVVEFNKHTFLIPKNKTNSSGSLRTGEFDVVRGNHEVLPLGFVDDVDTVLAFAKSFGLVTGGGSSYKYEDGKYGSLVALKQYLYENQDKYRMLKKQLVGLQRLSMGVPALPPDEYL